MARRQMKRQRIAEASIENIDSITDEKHASFTKWAREHGVDINGVTPQALPGRGLGLITTRRIKSGDRILFIPEDVIYKPDTAILRKHDLERVSSQAKLAMSALVHFTEESERSIWKSTWPTKHDFEGCMPLYWNRSIVNTMPKCMSTPFERQASDYEKDWHACSAASSKLGHTEADFRYFWMIVNSRSFHWAPPRKQPGYMVLCPFIDYMNHGPTGSGCTVVQRSDGYEVIAQRKYGK